MVFQRALYAAQDGLTRVMYGAEKGIAKSSFYDLVDKNLSGEQVPMATFEGDVLLLVNVASK